MINLEEREKVWEIISEIKFGMIITKNEKKFRARPMTIIQDTFEGKLYFFTNVKAEQELRFDEQSGVSVVFSDIKSHSYITLNGTAKLIKDTHLIDQFWSFMTSVWFPKGKDDPDIALIEIDISCGEFWDNDKGSFSSMVEILAAKFSKRIPHLGEKGTLGDS